MSYGKWLEIIPSVKGLAKTLTLFHTAVFRDMTSIVDLGIKTIKATSKKKKEKWGLQFEAVVYLTRLGSRPNARKRHNDSDVASFIHGRREGCTGKIGQKISTSETKMPWGQEGGRHYLKT